MKQVFILISLVLMSSMHLSAQKSISKADFEKLVDYANAQYVMAFIEQNDAEKPYFADTYIRIIRPELEKATLENFESIISYKRLAELLVDNNLALELAKRINDRKLSYVEFHDYETLIHPLSTAGWMNVDLSRAAAILNSLFDKDNFQIRQNHFVVAESEILNTQANQNRLQPEDLQQRLDTLQLFIWIAYAFLGIILILLTAFFLHFKQVTSRDAIIKLFSESKRVKEMFVWQNKSAPYTLTDKDINNIVDRALECIELSKIESKPNPEIENIEKPAPPPNDIKYLKSQNGKTFTHVENTPENSFFKLFNEKDGIADFDFSGDAAEAIAKQVFSDDICTIEAGGYRHGKSVETIKSGKIERVGNHWEVIEKLHIKLT